MNRYEYSPPSRCRRKQTVRFPDDGNYYFQHNLYSDSTVVKRKRTRIPVLCKSIGAHVSRRVPLGSFHEAFSL